MGQQHIPYSRMIVTFKLNVVENADKIKYSKVTLEKTGLLPEALYKTTAELRKAMKQSYESVAITTDDYKEAAPMEATPEVGPDGFRQATSRTESCHLTKPQRRAVTTAALQNWR